MQRTPADVRTSPRFAGVATLLRAPLHDGANELDVALCGVPWDAGSSFRAGARHGPAQIREMSRLIRTAHPSTRCVPFERARVADIGDAPVSPLSVDESLRSIQGFFESIQLAGARPLAVGGDHTITLPILRALATDGPLGLLQLDAHSDTQDTMLGQRVANGTPIRRAIEEGLVDPTRTVQAGVRGSLFAADELDWAVEQGVTLLTMERLDELGPTGLIDCCGDTVGAGPAYLTLDIDVLDPCFAPGTGGLEPGGMTVREILRTLRGLAGIELVGADITEVSPPLDPGGATALVACNLMFELLCLMVDSRP